MEDEYYDYSVPPEIMYTPAPHHILPMNWAAILIYSIVFLVGVPGNAMVVWVTTFEMTKTVNTVWFLNLAVADLLCCFSVPFTIMSLVLGQWPLGNIACKLIPSLLMVNMYASVLLLTVISIDRCILVLIPVWCHNRRTVNKAYLACLVIWILAFILSTPAFLFRHSQEHRDGTISCSYVYVLAGDQRYVVEHSIAICRCLFGFVFPFLLITACYSLLMKRVSQQLTDFKNTLKLILMVIVSFFVCWLPYHVVGLILALNHHSSPLFHSTSKVSPIITVLAFINSCTNPVIYVLMGCKLQKKVKRSIRALIRNTLVEDSMSGTRDSKSASESKSLEDTV